VRQLVVRPITKWFLKRQIRPLLDDIVLRPGPTDPDAAPAIDPPGS
jgi:hypothetical protein